MNLLTKICFNPAFAPQFKNPSGILGALVSKVMRENNFFVYPAIEEYADFRENQRVLEIGYGPGVGIAYFLNNHRIKLDGIDCSRMMHAEASRRNRRHVRSGALTLHHAEFETFDFQGAPYDQVVFANVIYFWEDLAGVFRKINSILAPGGKLVFYMSDKRLLDKNPVADNPLFIKYTADFVVGALEEAGFANVASNSVINPNNEFLIVRADKAR